MFGPAIFNGTVTDLGSILPINRSPLTYSLYARAIATPCHPDFAEQALALAANPAMLHAVVAADYARRWPDLTPPTLAQCQAFCDGAVVVDMTTVSVI